MDIERIGILHPVEMGISVATAAEVYRRMAGFKGWEELLEVDAVLEALRISNRRFSNQE